MGDHSRTGHSRTDRPRMGHRIPIRPGLGLTCPAGCRPACPTPGHRFPVGRFQVLPFPACRIRRPDAAASPAAGSSPVSSLARLFRPAGPQACRPKSPGAKNPAPKNPGPKTPDPKNPGPRPGAGHSRSLLASPAVARCPGPDCRCHCPPAPARQCRAEAAGWREAPRKAGRTRPRWERRGARGFRPPPRRSRGRRSANRRIGRRPPRARACREPARWRARCPPAKAIAGRPAADGP